MTRHSFDHELRIDSTTRRLQLARDANGAAMYAVTEIALSPQSQEREGLPPENILQFTQTNWVGGHGQRDFTEEDLYAEGQGIDTTLEGKVFSGPKINSVGISGGTLGSTPLYFCWFDAITKLMVATATKVFEYDGTNFVERSDLTGNTITDLKVYKDILYVALGSSTRYYYSANGSAYTQTDLTDGFADKFLISPNSAGTAEVLWKSKLSNALSNTTDGRTAAAGGVQWSSAATIGDTSADITGLMLLNDNLLVGKADNLLNYDSDGATHPLLDELRVNYFANNFKHHTKWTSALYASLGTAFCEVTSYNSFDVMGPLYNLSGVDKSGSSEALTADNDFLYAVMKEGSNYILYKGRERRIGGKLRWEWYPWANLSTNTCSTALVVQHTATDRRVWFGYGNNAGYCKIFDNPLDTTSAEYGAKTATAWLRTSYFDAGHRNWDKLLQYIITQTQSCTANVKITPKYRKDAETSFTALTGAITTNGTVLTYLTSALSAKRIQFQFEFDSNADGSTPVLTLFQARGVLKPETVRIHEATYQVGRERTRRGETIIDFLRTGRTTTNLIRFADLRYNESTAATNYHWAIMLPGYPQEVELIQEKGSEPEMALRCRFQEVDFTVS